MQTATQPRAAGARRHAPSLTGPLFLLLLALASTLRGEDWPHWRGSHRNDVTAERSRGKDGPWLHGKPRWQAAVGDKNAYSGPTSTPEYDGETGCLYMLSCDGGLNGWDTAHQGKRLWGMNLYDRFGVGQRPASKLELDDLRDYGYTTAPYAHGDWLLVEAGADDGLLVAFDKRTGERRWASQYGGPAGHTGGFAPITVAGVPCVALLALDHLVVVRLDSGHEGQTVATYPWKTAWANNVLTPAVRDDCVLISDWHTHRSLCKTLTARSGTRWGNVLAPPRQPSSKTPHNPTVFSASTPSTSRKVGLHALRFR